MRKRIIKPSYGRVIQDIVLVTLIFGPLIFLLLQTMYHTVQDPAILGLVIPSGRRLTLFINSLTLSTFVAVSVTMLGILAGSMLYDKKGMIWDSIKWCFLITAPIPPYIHALTWVSVVNLVNEYTFLNIPTSGLFMSYFVDTMAFLPLGVGLVIIGLSLIETPAIDAARLIKNDLEVFREIVLPLASPAIYSALGLVFILVIIDFTVPTLFTYNVYSLEIFSEFSASNNPSHSMALSIPLIVLTTAIIVLSIRGLRNTVQSSSISNRDTLMPWRFPGWFQMLQSIGLTVIILQFLVLIVGLVFETGSIDSMLYTVDAAMDDVFTSGFIGVFSALLGVIFGYVFSQRLNDSGIGWWVLIVFSLVLPSSLVGIGLITVYGRWLPSLYGTMFMPVMAVVIKFVSISSIVIYVQTKRMDPLLFEAAELFKHNELDSLLRIKLPLQKLGLMATAAIMFALSIGELGSTLLVIPPGRETLTIRIFNYLHYGGSQEVAGLCLVIVVVMMSASALGLILFNYNFRENER